MGIEQGNGLAAGIGADGARSGEGAGGVFARELNSALQQQGSKAAALGRRDPHFDRVGRGHDVVADVERTRRQEF